LDFPKMVLTLLSSKNKKGQAKPRIFFLFEPEALEFFKKMSEDKLPQAYLMTRCDGSAWVYEDGRPRYRSWSWGLQAAIRDANERLPSNAQIDPKAVAYSIRHSVITDLLSE